MPRPLSKAARKAVIIELSAISSVKAVPAALLERIRRKTAWSQEQYDAAERAQEALLGEAALADQAWRYDEDDESTVIHTPAKRGKVDSKRPK